MLELLGYIILILSVIVGAVIVFKTHNYLVALICLWIGVTIGSMLILDFKEEET